ncbi:MAG: hypothetical protein WA051_02355 [Minisyncoccia bacterium]
MLIYWLILAVLTAGTGLLWPVTGCWWFFTFMLAWDLGSFLFSLLWTPMAPSQPNTQSVGQRIGNWFSQHGGQLARTLLAVIAIMLFVFAVGYSIKKYGLPNCKTSGGCSSQMSADTTKKSATLAPSTKDSPPEPQVSSADLESGEPSVWFRLNPDKCSFKVSYLTKQLDTATVETGRGEKYKVLTRGDATDIGAVDSLRFTLPQDGRVIVAQTPRVYGADCNKK